MLGVDCHFAYVFNNLKTFLLALPQQLGQHSGINIADQIAESLSTSTLVEVLATI